MRGNAVFILQDPENSPSIQQQSYELNKNVSTSTLTNDLPEQELFIINICIKRALPFIIYSSHIL